MKSPARLPEPRLQKGSSQVHEEHFGAFTLPSSQALDMPHNGNSSPTNMRMDPYLRWMMDTPSRKGMATTSTRSSLTTN